MPHRVIRRAALAALCLAASGAAFADAKDDLVKAKCPNVEAWTEKMAKAHPALTDAGMDRDDKAGGFADPDLRDALRTRMAADRAARNAWIAAPDVKSRADAMKQVDQDNLAWMKQQFSRHGFPHATAVGLAGVDAAFTLVQHATADVPFMKSMLPQITARADAGELSKSSVAMLIDRLLRQDGKPQRYGTQYKGTNPKDISDMKMDPVEDPAHLDERRASMDLMPQADYECALHIYYAPDPSLKPAPAPASSTAH